MTDKNNGKNQDFIVCFCFNDSKIYIYSVTGILIQRVFYKKITEEYGKPVTVSEDGNYFIFRKSSSSELMHLIKVDLDRMLRAEEKEKGPMHVKTINIIDAI